MRPMTHGEIRGSLLLILLMAAVILFTFLSKGDSSDTILPRPADSISPTPAQIDSLRMEESASRYADSTSTPGTAPQDSAGAPSRHTRRPRTDKSVNRSTRKSARPIHTPSPSPLDRPV